MFLVSLYLNVLTKRNKRKRIKSSFIHDIIIIINNHHIIS